MFCKTSFSSSFAIWHTFTTHTSGYQVLEQPGRGYGWNLVRKSRSFSNVRLIPFQSLRKTIEADGRADFWASLLHVGMYVGIVTCMYACTYVCAYVYMYVCMHMQDGDFGSQQRQQRNGKYSCSTSHVTLARSLALSVHTRTRRHTVYYQNMYKVAFLDKGGREREREDTRWLTRQMTPTSLFTNIRMCSCMNEWMHAYIHT